MSEGDLNKGRKAVIGLSITALVMGIIILVVGFTVFSSFIYSESIYAVVGGMLIFFPALIIADIAKVNSKDKFNEVSVKYGWWVLSSGIGGIMVYAAPFFTRGKWMAGSLALVASVIATGVGIAILAYVRSRFEAPLEV